MVGDEKAAIGGDVEVGGKSKDGSEKEERAERLTKGEGTGGRWAVLVTVA
jgi:hypothetical protein